jgi:hypothetical protein
MSNELEQMRLSYESLGMSPEDISEDRGLDLTAVKAGLMQCSSKYRKDCGQEGVEEDTLNFSDEDLRRVNNVILEIALSSEDDNQRLKAAMYIRDDKKGRKDVVKQMGGMQFNILQFNETMRKARVVADGVKQSLLGGDVVNV